MRWETPDCFIAEWRQDLYIGRIRDFACLGLSQEHAESGYRTAQVVVRLANAFERFEETKMATGTVKFFNSQKGFGFIQQDGGGPDVFVHVSAVERAGMRGLVEGQKLTFDIEADRRSGKSAAANLQNAWTALLCRARRLSFPKIISARGDDVIRTKWRLVQHTIDGSIHQIRIDWRHMGEMLAVGHEVYSELKNPSQRAVTHPLSDAAVFSSKV
jgi:cold shock protein